MSRLNGVLAKVKHKSNKVDRSKFKFILCVTLIFAVFFTVNYQKILSFAAPSLNTAQHAKHLKTTDEPAKIACIQTKKPHSHAQGVCCSCCIKNRCTCFNIPTTDTLDVGAFFTSFVLDISYYKSPFLTSNIAFSLLRPPIS